MVIAAMLLAMAGCKSERVVRDHSVAAQFSAFNKNGWTVASGQSAAAQAKARAKAKKNQAVAKNTVNSPNNMFLSDVHWTTNLKVDDPTPGSPSVTHTSAIPGLGITPGGTLAPNAGPAMMGPADPAAPMAPPASGVLSSDGVVPSR
jgi:hypothetical protein